LKKAFSIGASPVKVGDAGAIQEGMPMRCFWTTIVLLLSTMPTLAEELPTRKAGLWELKMNDAPMGQQCIDAATEKMIGASAAPAAQQACSKRDVQHSGDTWTIDSTCTFKDKPLKTHVVAKGSFDSAYTQTTTTEGDADAIPGGKLTVKMDAKWLGPCAADQKPGDVIMGNGIKVNLLEMKKRGVLPGAPPPR
jgi:hypothetical protein